MKEQRGKKKRGRNEAKDQRKKKEKGRNKETDTVASKRYE